MGFFRKVGGAIKKAVSKNYARAPIRQGYTTPKRHVGGVGMAVAGRRTTSSRRTTASAAPSRRTTAYARRAAPTVTGGRNTRAGTPGATYYGKGKGYKSPGHGLRYGTQTSTPSAPSRGYGDQYIGRETTSTFDPSQSAFAGGGGGRIIQMAAPKAQAKDTSVFKDLLAKMQAQSEGARTANIARREQISSVYEDIIGGIKAPTGGEDTAYRTAMTQQMETTKKKDVGAGAQRLISSGLYGTEQAGGLERSWEADVGAPTRMKMEDVIAQRGEARQHQYSQRMTEAKLGKAGFLERIDEPAPDYNLLSQLAMKIGGA